MTSDQSSPQTQETEESASRRVPIANPTLGDREKERVEAILDSGHLADGDEVRAFESEFADYCGTSHGVAVANGTAALHAALEALGIGDGDTVVTSPMSFIATANAVRFAGAEPIFADIDPHTYNVDPDSVEAVIREHDGDVDAIMPVHLYGLPADMAPLRAIADAHDVPVITDAAQAHGATYRGERVGSLGDVACFSFYPTKNMTTGEGGMIVTDRDDVAERAARFINHGRSDSYEHVEVGHNFRMTNIAAAIGRVQLDRLPEYVEKRREHAARLDEVIEKTTLTGPVEPDDRTHAYHQYTVRSNDRETVREYLDEFGIDTAVYYPTPIHEQPPYADGDHKAPVTEAAVDEVVSLPVHPQLSTDDLNDIESGLIYADLHSLSKQEADD